MTSNNRSLLAIAEYVSVASSVVGSVLAVVFQQAIYGLAPVSLSLVLNLLNRRQLEQLTQQKNTANTQVQQLTSALNSLSVANTKFKQEVQNLATKQELTSIVSRVEELKEQQNGWRLSLVPMQSRLDDLIDAFNKRPELEHIESLATVIAALKQCIDEIPQPEQLQKQIGEVQQQADIAVAQLSERTDQLSETIEKVKRLEQAIARLQQQLKSQG